MQRMEIHRLPTAGPDDVSGLARLIDDGAVSARDVIAVLGKTEGNGCVNDWSRGFATSEYAALLAARLGATPDEVTSRVQFIMSGGTEGIITPHVTVFVRREVPATTRPGRGLVAGVSSTRALEPEELGTVVQIREVEAAVRAAMADAGIRDVADVHFVQIKCPLLTAEAITAASVRGARVATTSTYGSMGYSRGASALGVALALGEVERGLVSGAVVGGVIASVIGDPMVYVSGGAEHQGPSGGGPVAVIARRAS